MPHLPHHLIPTAAHPIDAGRWRVLVEVDRVTLPVVLEIADDVLIVHASIAGLPVEALAGELLALNRALRRVRIGAADGLVTIWADLDLAAPIEVLDATLAALTEAVGRVLALAGPALGGPGAVVAAA